MTYIRMTDGRDKGQIKDVQFVMAMELIKCGKALPLDMSSGAPLAVREVPRTETASAEVRDALPTLGNVDLRAEADRVSRLNQVTRGVPPVFRKKSR